MGRMGFKSYPRVYFELLFSGFMLVMGMSLSSAFLPIFANDLDPSGVLVGFTVSAWFLSRIFTELPSGVLAGWFGLRKLLVSGLALSALGTLLCSLADSILLLIAGRALWGLGAALFFMSSTAVILDLFQPNVRGRALGTFQGIEFLGSFIGAPIGGFIARALNYRSVFLSTFTLMICSLTATFGSSSLREVDARGRQRSRAGMSLRDVIPVLGSWNVSVVCVNSLSRMLVMMGLMSTVFPLFLNQQLGLSVELIGVIVSLRTAGLILATLTCGYLSDLLGRKPIVVGGMLIESACLYLYTLLPSFEAYLFIGSLDGFGGGMTMTSLVVLLSDVVPRNLRGGAVGMYRTFMDIGGFLGPMFFMALFRSMGFNIAFYSAILILAANIVFASGVKTGKTKEDSVDKA